jgi:Tfp pilus assembly PilM family ATPase
MEVAHDGDVPEVIRMGFCPVPADALAVDHRGKPEGLAELLRDLWTSEGFSTQQVVIAAPQEWVAVWEGLGGKSTFDRVFEQRRPVDLPWLPISQEQAVLDWQAIPSPRSRKGSALLVAGAERSQVLGRCSLLERAGLEVKVVEVGAMALRNALLLSHPDAAEGTVALIDLGHRTARVLVLEEGVPVLVRKLPTEPLPLLPPFAITEADRLTRAAELFRVLETELDTPGLQPENPWLVPHLPIGQLFVGGGGFLISGMLESFAEATGLPVRRVRPFEQVRLSPMAGSDGVFEEADALFLQVLGLALRRHEANPIHD